MRRRLWSFFPLLVLCALGVVFVLTLGERRDPLLLPSQQIGRPVPSFSVPKLLGTGVFSDQDLRQGKWSLLNVWASWCVSCRAEHPYLRQLALSNIAVFGLNFKDAPQSGREFLEREGNPFTVVGVDQAGKVALDFGVIAVPETYLIDGDGIVRAVYRGPLEETAVDDFLVKAGLSRSGLR